MRTKEQIKKRYRIVTDGRKFRVQKKFWRWWIDLPVGSDPAEFHTLEEVTDVVARMVNIDYSNQPEAWKVAEQSY